MTQQEKDIAVLNENFSLLDRRFLREVEKRLPLFYELATTILPSDTENEEPLLTLIRRVAHALPAAVGAAGTISAHAPLLQEARRVLQGIDRTAYITAVLSLLQERGGRLQLCNLLPMEEPSGTRIAYVRNPYTDEAYESFAATMAEPTVRYVDSFREGCEEVAAGEANFCILPYRHSGGYLSSFEELADRYSLHACAVCRVFHADGTDVSHFALYCRQLPICGEENGLHLRFSFLCADTEALSQHLSAASMMGISLTDLRAEPYAASVGALQCTATVLSKNRTLIPWLVYLSIFTDGYVCHGLYKEI